MSPPVRDRRARGTLVGSTVALGLACSAGVLWALCFQATPRGLAAALALVPLFLLARGRHPFLLGWVFGTSSWVAATPWLIPTLREYGGLPGGLAGLLLILLAAYLGLFTAVFAALVHRLWRSGTGWPLLAGAPAIWVLLELLRGVLLSGFPWNLAAYAWVDLPGALPASAWVGSWGISFLLVGCNGAVALSWVRRRWQPAVLVVAGLAILFAAAQRWALPAAGDRTGPGTSPVLRLIQPNIPNRLEFDLESFEDFQRLLEMSRAACTPGVLLIWPESATWPHGYETSPALRQAVADLTAGGCTILLNTNRSEGARTYNAVALVGAAGILATYDQRHLVPFGQYVPLRELLPFVGRVARSVGDFDAGEAIRLLPWSGQQLGVAICFEVVFPGEVAATVRRGASALVSVTNDAWYGDTAAPWQHLRAARFRAAETGRPLLRAAITGVSAWIDADGAVRQQLGVGELGVIEARPGGRFHRSLFVRAPWLVPALCGLLAIAALAGNPRNRRATVGRGADGELGPAILPPREDRR